MPFAFGFRIIVLSLFFCIEEFVPAISSVSRDVHSRSRSNFKQRSDAGLSQQAEQQVWRVEPCRLRAHKRSVPVEGQKDWRAEDK